MLASAFVFVTFYSRPGSFVTAPDAMRFLFLKFKNSDVIIVPIANHNNKKQMKGCQSA